MIPAAALAAWASHRAIVQGPAIDRIHGLGACAKARNWCRPLSLSDAWLRCERADWLLWAAARLGVDRHLVVRAACACARTALHLVPTGEDRPRVAIETAEAWTRGEATIKQVRAASSAASSASAWAASAWAASAWAAWAAADADADAADAAARAAADAPRTEALARMAVLVRQHISLDDVVAAIRGAP